MINIFYQVKIITSRDNTEFTFYTFADSIKTAEINVRKNYDANLKMFNGSIKYIHISEITELKDKVFFEI